MTDLAAAALAWTRTAPSTEFTTRQLALLGYLADRAVPAEVYHIADHLGVSKPVITRAVNTLQALGLVEREKMEDDKRRCLVAPTAAGRALRESLRGLR